MTLYTLTIDEQTFEVEVGSIRGDLAEVTVNQVTYFVKVGGMGPVATQTPSQLSLSAPIAVSVTPTAFRDSAPMDAPKGVGKGVVTAPIPGKIMLIMVKPGDKVTAGQVLAVIEAMKMENNIVSPVSGTVKEIKANKEDDVATGDVIMVIG